MKTLKPGPKSCNECVHLCIEEDVAYSNVSWKVCGARQGIENLKQWPFKKTTCHLFERRKEVE